MCEGVPPLCGGVPEDGGMTGAAAVHPSSLPGLKVAAGVVLVALWIGIGWVFMHRGRIKRELVRDDALPASAPRALLFVVLSALFVGFSALMLYFLLS
jgi:hypothetical protein